MKHRFSKRTNLILTTIIALLVLTIAYVQFFHLLPLKNELSTAQRSLESEQKLLEGLTGKTVNQPSVTLENTRVLQQKVPVKAMQDQFILDLEKAETISTSEIKSMSFSEDVQVEAAPNQDNQQNSTTTPTQPAPQANSAAGSNTEPAASQGSASTKPMASMPSGIKKLSVVMNVESPTYQDFETFITTLESLKRIVVVEEISYSAGQETTSLESKDQPFSYSLTCSVYYMPSLEDLQSQLPSIDAPPPANKENPLTTFADMTNQK